MKNVFQLYRDMIKKRPSFFIAAGLIYFVFFTVYIYKSTIERDHTSEIKYLTNRLIDTQSELEKTKDLINKINLDENKYSFFKDIELRENIKSEELKNNILRLFDYANFAIKKDDFKYAEEFYIDSFKSFETSLGHYYLGRLYFIQGNERKAEAEWRKAISLDKEIIYPEIRFYLGILLQKESKLKETKELLKVYIENE